jgi:hypothetical protein
MHARRRGAVKRDGRRSFQQLVAQSGPSGDLAAKIGLSCKGSFLAVSLKGISGTMAVPNLGPFTEPFHQRNDAVI